jgi:hypothetical protein
MKKLALILFVILGLSCQDEETSSTVIATEIELSLSDGVGNDLLNPNYQNGFKEENIKHFYLINGVKKEVFNSNEDTPKRIGITKYSDRYRIGIGMNTVANENGEVISLIQWKENDIDTIIAKLQITQNTTVIINPKFNGVPIPETEETGYFLEIIK